MAKQSIGEPIGLFHFPGIGHFLVILIVTGVEIIGLVGWLAITRNGSLASAFYNLPVLTSLAQLNQYIPSLGQARFAAVFLGLFLLIEHIISQIDQTGRIISGKEFVEILAFTSLEVIIWAVWLLLIPINGILAFLFFLASLYIEHQITDNVKKAQPFLHFTPRRNRVFRGLILLTIFEVVGGVVWVAQGSVIAIAVGSTIEHYIARNVGQISETVGRKIG